ncbi:MAG: MarR family transcriptional regulator [Alphaproteobacteria bacterium]|nr:MarR family transcriptional regulator [Alphaproteobacteria bacterium]
MSCKEIVRLLESNIWTIDKLADKLRLKPAESTGYPRQQMAILVRLHQGGRARLKDIARREHVSAPNLCSVFRKLERDGLVLRVIDEDDRRNTWYSVTPAGAQCAVQAMNIFRAGVEQMFANLSETDMLRMTDSLRTINEVLKNVELDNA